jgi:glycogen synthase
MLRRIIYAGGPGDIIHAYRCWRRGEHDPTEVSVTFSSQFQDFCREVGARAYLIGYHPRRELVRDEEFVVEHRPKRMRGAKGVWFHVSELLYALSILTTAVRFRADTAVIDSGTTHFFLTATFRLFGIRVVPILQNSLWPAGRPPTRFAQKALLWLDSWFFRYVPVATLCVSPECERQVELLTGGRHGPLIQHRAQFLPGYFERIPPPPPHDRVPFQIIFIGRVIPEKGVFDLLDIARRVDAQAPNRVRWVICGRGAAFDELCKRRDEIGVGSVVDLRGWTSLEELIGVYAQSHAAIVPTRNNYNEGFAMTAAEAVLAGRPVLTSRVVPALEVIRPAAYEATPEDVGSYAEGVIRMISDPAYYEQLSRACADLARPFYDRSMGMAAALKEALSPYVKVGGSAGDMMRRG